MPGSSSKHKLLIDKDFRPSADVESVGIHVSYASVLDFLLSLVISHIA